MDAFDEGHAAYLANKPASSNKYDYGTKNYDDWLSGWEYADAQSV